MWPQATAWASGLTDADLLLALAEAERWEDHGDDEGDGLLARFSDSEELDFDAIAPAVFREVANRWKR